MLKSYSFGHLGNTKTRLDLLIVERGLAESRSQAQALLLAGRILAPGVAQLKPGAMVRPDQPIELVAPAPFVSRGGEKLEGALKEFGLDVKGLVCWDIGASTGGFTDCLLQRGAKQVVCVDVGHSQLHEKIRRDPRVINLEKTHVLYLTQEKLKEHPPQFISIDVSFISLEKVLPYLATLLPAGTEAVALVKPQFEAGPKQAPKGVVRDPDVRARVVRRLSEKLAGWGFQKKGECVSPLKGPKGNEEFFLYFRRLANEL